MSVKQVGPDSRTRFNYIVCLDIVVLACILVVAGRPDGLAITLSAIIVAAGALVYRCSVAVRSSVSGKSRKPEVERAFNPATQNPAAEIQADGGAKSKSWLRDSE